jgi:NAD(P)-dependent dehydrogenase (short-subunit alcohol dehydrogenase family)
MRKQEDRTMGKLDGKVAIITGASSGIGQACAALFAREGAKVAVAARSMKGLEETVAMIAKAGSEGLAVKTDVSSEEDMKRLVAVTVERFGKLDIMFGNAGIQNTGKRIHDVNAEDWDRVIATNLRGVYLGMKYAIPHMLDKGGVILNTTSPAGVAAIPFNAAYCASKAAIIQLTKAAAYEYARFKIRANTLCPGATDTPTLRAAWSENEGKLPEGWLKSAPMDPMIVPPEDIAPLALYLVSDEAYFVTGANYVIDGGFLAI